jgi:uncharacterized membrane protein YhaH (DUF805 family)
MMNGGYGGHPMLGAPGLVVILLVVLILIWPSVRILHKAGYSGWWCLLAFVPLVNLVMLYIFAFGAEWPSQRRHEVRQFD